MMAAFITANLSISAINLLIVIAVWICIFAGVDPPRFVMDHFAETIVGFVVCDLAVWALIFAAAKRTRLTWI